MKYHVTLDGETRELELTPDGVRMGGREIRAELATVPGSSLRHLRLGDRGYRLRAARDEDGWVLELRGHRLTLEVEDERTRAIRELAGSAAAVEGPRELTAPMPGLVVRVLVEPGQEVASGDPLLVMEAMKMENELRAEASGTVSGVRVREGETVEQREVLITIESDRT